MTLQGPSHEARSRHRSSNTQWFRGKPTDPDCAQWFCQTMPAPSIQARGRSGLTPRLTMCVGHPPAARLRSTSTSQWPCDSNTLRGVFGAVKAISLHACGLCQRPAAISQQIVSDSPCQASIVGRRVSQLVWSGQRGTHWACQARQIFSERQTS